MSKHLSDDLRVDVQNPVRLNGGLEPQPDLAVVRARDYRGLLPTPEDVLLLIEVADTSLAHDCGVKLPMHAEAGIREVWIVDLTGGTVERHTGVFGEGYRFTMRAGRGERLRSETLPGLSSRADHVLGPATPQ